LMLIITSLRPRASGVVMAAKENFHCQNHLIIKKQPE